MKPITESHIETLAIESLQALGWEYIYGIALAPGAERQERENYEQIILTERLRKAVSILNPHIPGGAQEQAVQKVLRIYSPDLLYNNETFHTCLVEGVKIPYQQDGYERSYEVALVDFEDSANNEFVVVNQYTVSEKNHSKRPDVLLFVNGIPLVVMELKNAVSEKATVERAFNQIRTYQELIPSLFTYNAFSIISDGFEGKAGTITSALGRYMVWKSANGIKDASRFAPQLEIMIKGMLNHATLLDLIRNFIVFEKSKREDPKTGLTQLITEKKVAAYHQYFAVNKAVESTVTAASTGTKKGGVVWHTQGSGKSLSMVFYAGKIITRAQMQNPTLVVLTDRNDLDDQLFGTFASCRQLLRQDPVQAENRGKLKELLKVASGGIVFTTIQKFLAEDGKETYDLLSERSNIIMIADEAHRTQYGFEAKLVDVKNANKEVIGKRIAYGFAKYMRDALPNATYIGFTGTPIESTDVNTPQVFGQYIDIYDIAQAVNDGATVKIWYESRLAKVNLDEEGRRLIAEFDRELEQDELTETQKAKSKWTRLEAIIGNERRINNLAKDIVTHFEIRQSVFEGKGMIVAMSRRIAAELYNAIIRLKPEWHSEDPAKGAIKVIMTAASDDGPLLSKLKTSKSERKDLAERMKDPADPLKLVIVRDMWLTGFDAPSLHTLYIDKPMRGHNLMQAIARVNRVFKDKPGGLVVDYLGIATDLKKALSFYSDAGGKGEPTDTQERAVEMLLEKVELVRQLFAQESSTKKDIILEEPLAYYSGLAGFNYNRFFSGAPQEKLAVILQAEEHVLGLPDGKERFIKEVTLLSQAFALAVPDEEAMALKGEIAFFQAVKSRLTKFESVIGVNPDAETDSAIKQIVDEALSSDQVVDIFDAAGIRKPLISVLSDEFMLEIKGMKHKNLALELLKKILNDEIKTRTKTNLVKSRALLEMLESSILKYQNNLLSTAEIIQELINLAKEITESDKEAERLGLSTEEVAFYNALEINDSAVQVLGDEQLRLIAREIAEKVKANATIDWAIRESARAKLMVIVRRTLNKYGYPPDMQQKAIETVLKQAELLADWQLDSPNNSNIPETPSASYPSHNG
ncbi:type I restriction endonuclease subunit R [Daejeonella sp.]|uniref:type I restriction endonuclease subunit R n=1 Tax=Daejeonella sp. TaxID=2805397 RepID=UPI0030C2AE8A